MKIENGQINNECCFFGGWLGGSGGGEVWMIAWHEYGAIIIDSTVFVCVHKHTFVYLSIQD